MAERIIDHTLTEPERFALLRLAGHGLSLAQIAKKLRCSYVEAYRVLNDVHARANGFEECSAPELAGLLKFHRKRIKREQRIVEELKAAMAERRAAQRKEQG